MLETLPDLKPGKIKTLSYNAEINKDTSHDPAFLRYDQLTNIYFSTAVVTLMVEELPLKATLVLWRMFMMRLQLALLVMLSWGLTACNPGSSSPVKNVQVKVNAPAGNTLRGAKLAVYNSTMVTLFSKQFDSDLQSETVTVPITPEAPYTYRFDAYTGSGSKSGDWFAKSTITLTPNDVPPTVILDMKILP